MTENDTKIQAQDLVDFPTACKLLGISRGNLTYWAIVKGIAPPCVVGRYKVFTSDQIETIRKFMAERKARAEAEDKSLQEYLERCRKAEEYRRQQYEETAAMARASFNGERPS